MAIMTSNEQERNSRLDQRITSDLRERTQSSAGRGTEIDFTGEEAAAKNTKKTGRFTWIWVILIVLAVLSLVSIAFF